MRNHLLFCIAIQITLPLFAVIDTFDMADWPSQMTEITAHGKTGKPLLLLYKKKGRKFIASVNGRVHHEWYTVEQQDDIDQLIQQERPFKVQIYYYDTQEDTSDYKVE